MSFSLNDPRKWLDFVPRTLQASPLYSALWEQMKEDQEMLLLLELVPKDQPLPITFFTAINYLVLGEPHNPLMPFYSYFQPEHTRPASEAYPFFRAFALAHREALQELLPTARLQTNEVTRCANLLPAFLLAYQHGGRQALNMIELGSSVGLNLFWDRYAYRYRRPHATEDLLFHRLTRPVQVTCELVANMPTFPLNSTTILPRVARCQGIELCPRDIHNEQDLRWVRAAIWPEELVRYRTLDAALIFAQQQPQPLPIHVGDACDLLPTLLADIPTTQTALVWHSYALNQGPLAVKKRIEEQIAEASRHMPIYRVGLEFVPHAPLPRLEWSIYQDGKMRRQEVLAECAIHGERMAWLADPHDC